MNQQEYQAFMADMIRRQNPNAAMTMESQVNSALSPPMAQSVSGGSGGGSAPMSLLTEEGQAAFDAKEAMRMRSQDFSGEERAIEAQMAMAEQMRTGKSPQGRTVGPLDVYVGPNWGEVAGDFATKIAGGYFGKKAAEKDADLSARLTESALEKSMAEQKRYDDKLALDTRGVVADEATLDARLAADAQSKVESEADRASREAIASTGQAGQNLRANIEMVYINEDGTPDYSRTRFANPSANGMVWGNGEVVDEARWQGRDDRNLTAATSGESRGTAAQATAQYRANTFGDALAGMQKRLVEGYDPGSPRALIDKYANKSDFFRGASTGAGQQWNSDANTVKEAALRTSTGAAAPNKENSEYMTTLIPGPWDTQGTQDFKMRKLNTIHNRLLEVAGLEGTTQADLDAESDLLLEDARREENAIKAATTKQNGDTWEDATHRYRKVNGELQSEKK